MTILVLLAWQSYNQSRSKCLHRQKLDNYFIFCYCQWIFNLRLRDCVALSHISNASIIISALSEESARLLLLTLSVHPKNFFSFELRLHLRYSRFWLGMFCKCVVKILEFSFLPQGSYKGRKMTFFMKLLSLEFCLQFIELSPCGNMHFYNWI